MGIKLYKDTQTIIIIILSLKTVKRSHNAICSQRNIQGHTCRDTHTGTHLQGHTYIGTGTHIQCPMYICQISLLYFSEYRPKYKKLRWRIYPLYRRERERGKEGERGERKEERVRGIARKREIYREVKSKREREGERERKRERERERANEREQVFLETIRHRLRN